MFMFGQKNDDQNQVFHDGSSVNPVPPNSNPPSDFVGANFGAPTPVQNDATTAPVMTDGGMAPTADPNPDNFMAPATPLDTVEAPTDAPAAPINTPNGDELLGMKQQALQELTPLVDHLEQPPEERFRTLMMMIQASDDHTKLNEAFEAAKKITDDKARAQALLDVINEINYFTQQNKS